MIDASAEVGKLITRLSEVQTQRDKARRERDTALAEVARLKTAIDDYLTMVEVDTEAWMRVWYDTAQPPASVPAEESESAAVPAAGLLSEDVSREGEAL